MKQYLFYGCTDKYERGPMELLKSICVRDGSSEANALEHERHFRSYFEQKEYSCLYVLVFNLDPANGVTEVLRNEYAENPLKHRTVINAAARKPTTKARTLEQILANEPPQFTMFEDEAAHQ